MRIGSILLFLILPLFAVSQTAPDTYLIFFSDKENTPYSLDQPEEFLSPRSIQRRITQGIALDELDLPVDPAYISAVLDLGEIQLINRSKWFNTITIRTTDLNMLEQIGTLPFVLQIKSTRNTISHDPIGDKFSSPGGQRDLDYGASFTQVSMMNGHLLHELSQGEGMLIGVLDSGFEGVNWMPAFTPLHQRNGIVLIRDLVAHDGDVFLDHWHGRSVLSCMAAILDGQLIGTAPQSDYVLLRTEDTNSEYLVEEDNWIAGAELCDSIGCDVLNTSLGYTRFDDPTQDHAYLDLDGNTTRISIAAGIASQKGMIPVQSAGNSGSSDWFYISAPADAHDILAVGAVGDLGQFAPFSSHGPSADGRVKPDVAAMGWGTIAVSGDGITGEPVNGTSFSSPLVAGLVACLWKLHPQRTAHEIMDAVRRSASQYSDPDHELGYGIPDFMLAHELLTLSIGQEELDPLSIQVFPIPFQDRLEITFATDAPIDLHLFDLSGRSVWSYRGIRSHNGSLIVNDAVLAELKAGSYILSIEGTGRRVVKKLLKTD